VRVCVYDLFIFYFELISTLLPPKFFTDKADPLWWGLFRCLFLFFFSKYRRQLRALPTSFLNFFRIYIFDFWNSLILLLDIFLKFFFVHTFYYVQWWRKPLYLYLHSFQISPISFFLSKKKFMDFSSLKITLSTFVLLSSLNISRKKTSSKHLLISLALLLPLPLPFIFFPLYILRAIGIRIRKNKKARNCLWPVPSLFSLFLSSFSLLSFIKRHTLEQPWVHDYPCRISQFGIGSRIFLLFSLWKRCSLPHFFFFPY